MQFYVKYVKDGLTVIEELQNCKNRGEAAGKLVHYKEIADDGGVALTSDSLRLAQWRELVRQEEEITPKRGIEK